ncbi:methylenetetrahydrofolate reductase C-terminal domain-containing protein [candidate division KSB1 bacterium]|nr:methylenetetrahydrofolate reductase C-terminal domain-containing protein [candidate division KSB1 bacterium]
MPKEIVSSCKPPLTARERKISHLLRFFEDLIKVPLFGCQKCGECILSSTGFVCCQRCPKRLRNGPCGGTGQDGSCEVYPERKCVWYRIYFRSSRLRRLSLLYKLNKIHNWNLEGTSAWLNVFKKRIDAPVGLVRNDKQKVKEQIADDL